MCISSYDLKTFAKEFYVQKIHSSHILVSIQDANIMQVYICAVLACFQVQRKLKLPLTYPMDRLDVSGSSRISRIFAAPAEVALILKEHCEVADIR